MLKLPILGMILRKIGVARFCRTLSTLMASGVPILDGLEITARTAGNSVIEDAIMVTRQSIERGETVVGAAREDQVFPAMVTQMINVGEATGALDAMLSKIADFYEEEVDTAVAGLMTLLEPVMIAFLGIIVGGIVISMYMPIFRLIRSSLADAIAVWHRRQRHVPAAATAAARAPPADGQRRPCGHRSARCWSGRSCAGSTRRPEGPCRASSRFYLLEAVLRAVGASTPSRGSSRARPWLVEAQLSSTSASSRASSS